MIKKVLGPVIPTVLRICGFLPFSSNLDFSGYPVFSKCWFCYSILLYFLFVLFITTSCFKAPHPQNIEHIIVGYLFVSISCTVNWAACKSGALCKIVHNFLEFDRKVEFSRKSNREVRILLTVAITCFVLTLTSDIYYLAKHGGIVSLCFPFHSVINLVSQSLTWILMCLLKQKMRLMNLCLARLTAQLFEQEEREAKDERLSLTLKTLNELSAITLQNLSLIQSSFGAQIVASYGVFFDQVGLDTIMVQILAVVLEVDYFHFVPWALSISMRFIFITWITSSIQIELELFSKGLTRTVRSEMSSSFRRQMKTLQLGIYHQSAESFARSFSVYSVDNFLTSSQYFIFNFVMAYLNSISLQNHATND